MSRSSRICPGAKRHDASRLTERRPLPQVTLCADNAREAFENVEILKLRLAPYYTEEMALQAEDTIEQLKATKRRSAKRQGSLDLDAPEQDERQVHRAKVVFRNLGQRLRLLSYFQPSVEEKNVASVQLIMARRELHRLLLSHVNARGFDRCAVVTPPAMPP